jgi:hypothetical protein
MLSSTDSLLISKDADSETESSGQDTSSKKKTSSKDKSREKLLADEVYRLLKEELRIERQRLGR